MHTRCRRFGRAAAAAAAAIALVAAGCSAAPEPTPGAGPVAASATGMPPWPAPSDVPARVAAAGLDLGPMGTAEHYHPRLQVIVDGTPVVVPANIGVDPTTGAMSALHTHEPDGTIHIEAHQAGEVFTLGQLFTEWGVPFTATQIGGVTAPPGQTVRLTSDGEPVTGDPNDLRLQPDQQIVLQLP